MASHQTGHLFSIYQLHSTAILFSSERQTAIQSTSCLVLIQLLYKVVKEISVQPSQAALLTFGLFYLIHCPRCVGMHVHAVATFVISADPEMISRISRSVQERHIESNLNKAFCFLFYSLTCRPSVFRIGDMGFAS
jgi:hypothetical protein